MRTLHAMNICLSTVMINIIWTVNIFIVFALYTPYYTFVFHVTHELI